MVEPVRHDLKCYKGQTWSQDIFFKQNKTAVDLTGVTAAAQIRPSENSPVLTADISVTVYGSEGKINLYLSDSQTAKLKPGFYAWDLKATDGQDVVTYWIKGQFIVTGRVTE